VDARPERRPHSGCRGRHRDGRCRAGGARGLRDTPGGHRCVALPFGPGSCWAGSRWTMRFSHMTCWGVERTAWGCDGRPDRARAAALGPSAERILVIAVGAATGRGRADADRQRRRALHRAGGDRRGAAPVCAAARSQADRRYDHARGAAPALRASCSRRARTPPIRSVWQWARPTRRTWTSAAIRCCSCCRRAGATSCAKSRALSDRRYRSVQGVLQGIAGAQRGSTASRRRDSTCSCAVGCVLHARS